MHHPNPNENSSRKASILHCYILPLIPEFHLHLCRNTLPLAYVYINKNQLHIIEHFMSSSESTTLLNPLCIFYSSLCFCLHLEIQYKYCILVFFSSDNEYNLFAQTQQKANAKRVDVSRSLFHLHAQKGIPFTNFKFISISCAFSIGFYVHSLHPKLLFSPLPIYPKKGNSNMAT